jgi:hypothetical protein
MIVQGLDTIRGSVDEAPAFGKFIVNETGIIFFRASVQHRDIKLNGLSYEDDYQGNALAGSFISERVDIRFHRDFSDDRIRSLWSRVRSETELSFLRAWPLYYKNRLIS